MSEVPTWQGATAGQRCDAGLMNQFLTNHNTTMLWAGTAQSSVTTSGASATGTNGLYLAQSFSTTANQTAIGYVQGPISTTTTSGASLVPTALSLYTNNNGSPGTLIVSTVLTAEYCYTATNNGNTNVFANYPLPATGLSPNALYWLVVNAANTGGNQYTWFRSASTSGAATSPDGVTWTLQSYGFRYRIQDQTVTGNVTCTWEDGGLRWTNYTYNTNGTINQYFEYTDCQGTNAYVQSCRTYSYSQGMLTAIA